MIKESATLMRMMESVLRNSSKCDIVCRREGNKNDIYNRSRNNFSVFYCIVPGTSYWTTTKGSEKLNSLFPFYFTQSYVQNHFQGCLPEG